MVLVDTSVWVGHFRQANGDPALKALLARGAVMAHPWVVGELACGRLRNRGEILALLGALPQAPVVTAEEALSFIEIRGLAGKDLGYVDVHLLASAMLAHARMWSFDEALTAAARELAIAFDV